MNLTPLFWTLILIAVSISLFLTLAARARARLKQKYRPIGQMIDIGGYRLHLYVEGEGSHTVIFDAGVGGIGLSWELVRPAIAKSARVVTYDRAGLGGVVARHFAAKYPADAIRYLEEGHAQGKVVITVTQNN